MEFQEVVADGALVVAALLALAAGLVSFLSPCVLPLLPGYLAYVSGVAGGDAAGSSGAGATSAAGASSATVTSNAKTRERRRMVIGSILFVAGFTAVFVAMMSLAGSVGAWLWRWEDLITRVMGVVIIVMGLVFMGLVGKLQQTTRFRFKPRIGLAGAPVLGAVFAIGWTPCIGPTLAVIFSLSMQSATAGRGALLAVIYCIGLGLPFILAALGFGWVTTATAFFRRHIRVINIIGGAFFIVIGLLMVSGLWTRMMYALQAVMGNYVTLI